MRVLLLCGGRGIIDPDTHTRIPKCLLKIGNKPLIWHVMKLFSSYGHTEFVLSMGAGGDLIKNYFLNAFELNHDIELKINSKEVKSLNRIPEEDWVVKLINTGISASTGARIARCERYLCHEPFFISYTDILADVNISNLLDHHNLSNKLLTVTGVNPPSRFGTFYLEDSKLKGYKSDALLNMKSSKINGGFMVANEDIFKKLSPITECNLELEIFDQLLAEEQLNLFTHDGFWRNVDTERDLNYLQNLYTINKRPWLGIN